MDVGNDVILNGGQCFDPLLFVVGLFLQTLDGLWTPALQEANVIAIARPAPGICVDVKPFTGLKKHQNDKTFGARRLPKTLSRGRIAYNQRATWFFAHQNKRTSG